MRRLVGPAGGLHHDRILEVPEVAFDGFLEDFVVADGGLQERVPVHQPLAAVDQALAEQVEERLADGPRAAFVEREARALPSRTSSPSA